MHYQVEITQAAKKRLKKFDREIQRRFFKKVDKIKDQPKTFLKPLRSDMKGQWEYYFERRFRIIFKVNEKEKIVTIEAIKHKNEMK